MTAQVAKEKGLLFCLIPPGQSPEASRSRRSAPGSHKETVGRHLDKVAIAYVEFISMHNSSLQYSALYPPLSLFSLHTHPLVRFISSRLPSLISSLRLPSRASLLLFPSLPRH